MEDCSICRNKIKLENSVLTSCNHRFCSDCFFNWMKHKTDCPNCRKQFGPIIGQEERLELEQTVEAAREWEEYANQLKEDVIILETRINQCCEELIDKERELSATKSNMQKIINECNLRKEKIINECNLRKEKILREERIWRERQQKMIEYMRERQLQNSKRRFYGMRF